MKEATAMKADQGCIDRVDLLTKYAINDEERKVLKVLRKELVGALREGRVVDVLTLSDAFVSVRDCSKRWRKAVTPGRLEGVCERAAKKLEKGADHG